MIVGLLLTGLFLLPLYFFNNDEKQPKQPEQQQENNACILLIKVNGEELEIDEYLIGVLAGEMPVSFHEEALKAQAIAARTYALKQTNFGEKEIQSTTAHQVFQPVNMRQEKWQAAFATNENKIAQAVYETANQVVMYDGQLISAMFHSASFEKTESAKNYSGNPVPYLQMVTSPEQAATEQMEFTFPQLNERLKVNLKSTQYKQIKLTRNDSNRVEQVNLNGVQWTGREFRERLGLRSTNFTWQWSTKGVTIITRGYGHGVGMSQYGANTMAQSGQTATQILAHYYPSTKLEQITYCTE